MKASGGFEVKQRTRLLRERDRFRDLLDELRAESMGRSDFEPLDITDDDAASDATEGRLAAIDQALDRIDSGRDGLCEMCGSAIPIRRLEALPATAVCRGCMNWHHTAGSAARPAAPRRSGCVGAGRRTSRKEARCIQSKGQ